MDRNDVFKIPLILCECIEEWQVENNSKKYNKFDWNEISLKMISKGYPYPSIQCSRIWKYIAYGKKSDDSADNESDSDEGEAYYQPFTAVKRFLSRKEDDKAFLSSNSTVVTKNDITNARKYVKINMIEQHRNLADNNANSISNSFKPPYLFSSQNVSNIITTSNITELISANNPSFHELLYSKDLLYKSNVVNANQLNKQTTSIPKNQNESHIINTSNKSLNDDTKDSTANLNNHNNKSKHTDIISNNHSFKASQCNKNTIENNSINNIPTILTVNNNISNNNIDNYINNNINNSNNHIVVAKRKGDEDFNLSNSKKQYINNEYEQSINIITIPEMANEDIIDKDNQDNYSMNIINNT